MRMFKTMFFSSSSFLFGPLSFFCDALDWPDAKTEEGKGLEDRIASFTRCLKYTWSQSTFNILKDWLLDFWWDRRGGEGGGGGGGVGVFSSKQTYSYTKVLLKKLILAEDFWKKSSQNHNSQLESQVVKRLSGYL